MDQPIDLLVDPPMFRSKSGGRAGSDQGQMSEQSPSNNATPAQRIQIAQTASRARPIHIPPRQMNTTPDETEPSYSYEDSNFYFPKEEEVADAFHKRFAASSSSGYSGGRTKSLGSSGFSNSNDSNAPSLLTSSLNNAQDGSGQSNFWRTTSRKPSDGRQSSSESGGKDSRSQTSNKNNKTPNGKGVVRRRQRLRSSGQSRKQIGSDNNHDRNQNKSSGENNFKDSQQEASPVPIRKNNSNPRFPHSNSATSLGSTGSLNKNDNRLKSKQRDAVRRLKLDAQQQLSEDGGVVDNGYYTEVPTIGGSQRIPESNGGYDVGMGALEEEMSGDFYSSDDTNPSVNGSESDDGSHSFLHSNLNSSIKQSTELVSAAGAAAAAVSEYRNAHNRANNAATSLTHHINNLQQQSTTSSHSHQPPVLLNDHIDSRSTASTMSDLSMTDSYPNRHQLHSSSSGHARRTSLTSLNSILDGKPSPMEAPALTSLSNAHFHHQRSVGSVISTPHMTSDIPSTMVRSPHSDGGRYAGTQNTATSVTPTPFHRLHTPEFTRKAQRKTSDSKTQRSATEHSQLQNKIHLILDACEQKRFSMKKKLILEDLRMTAADIPVRELYGTALGQSLHKLSLSKNRLSTIPRKLVTCLPLLKTLDISECELHQLPERWNLPLLRRLNVSHNRLSDFPDEVRFLL